MMYYVYEELHGGLMGVLEETDPLGGE